MEFLTKVKLKILGQKYDFSQLKKLNKDIMESVLVLERGLVGGFLSFAAIDRLLWELSMRPFLDQREFVKVLTILLRRAEFTIPKDQAARDLYYVLSLYSTLLILHNMPNNNLLKALMEGGPAEAYQKELKKIWETALKRGSYSLLFYAVSKQAHPIQICAFVQDLEALAFRAGSSFSLLTVLKEAERHITVRGMAKLQNAFDFFPWIPKFHFLFLKYQGKFLQQLKATCFSQKISDHPLDQDLATLLPLAVTRMLLYDSGRVFVNVLKFFDMVGWVFEEELLRKKKDQKLERQILFRRPDFLDRVMKNFNAMFGGHFWSEFVGKFLKEFSRDGLDLNNPKRVIHVHLLFREHFAYMLKSLPRMPPELLHFLRLVLSACNRVFPPARRATFTTSRALQDASLKSESLGRLLREPLCQQEKGAMTSRRSEIGHLSRDQVPKDFTGELRPIFNFFYLTFIVSNSIVQLEKEEHARMQMALVFLTKITMNICYGKRFEDNDPHQLQMMNACIQDWHRDLGYTTLKMLEEGPGLSFFQEDPVEQSGRSLSSQYEEQKFRLALLGKRNLVPFSLVQLDYDVVMRCMGLLDQEEFPEIKMKNEALLPGLKEEVPDGKAYEVLAGLFNAFAG